MSYSLITGGSRGICFAIAEALAKRKYDLVLVARTLSNLETAREQLLVLQGQVKPLFLNPDKTKWLQLFFTVKIN